MHVVAAVIHRNGKYLLCQRPAHKHHGGCWEFPGGKLEAGESALTAITRELYEELQLTVRSAECLAIIHALTTLTIEFMTTVADGEPVLLEHQNLAWCTRDELLALHLAPADREFAEQHLTSK